MVRRTGLMTMLNIVNMGPDHESCPPPSAAQLTEAAREYRDNHHWVPLRLNGKAPCGAEWHP